MGLLSLFLGEKKSTASVAKERLQLIIAHERGARGLPPTYLADLQRELMAVVSKYVKVDLQDIKVQMERQDNLEVLQVKIELPEQPR